MKAGPKAPPTQLLNVPLHAAEFIKLSVCRAVKDPGLWDFPLLACRLNLTVFEHCAWLRAYIPHHTSDTRSCLLSTAVPFPSFFFFFVTRMLVKRYIQQLTDLFDGDEELIYGHTFIITHNSSLQELYPVEILVFFFSFGGLGGGGAQAALIL